MCKYPNQIFIRWLSFIVAFVLVATVLFLVVQNYPEGLGKAQLKEFSTHLSVYAELAPFYYWIFLFILACLLLLTGVPSILVFCCFFCITTPISAFFATLSAQFLASIMTIHLNRKKSAEKILPPYILSELLNSKFSAGQLTFYPRFYLAYPSRTLDLLTAAKMKDSDNLSGIYLPVLTATFIRMVLPVLWAGSLIRLIKNFTPTPVQDSSNFLFWSAFLITQIILPKVPELMICKKELISLLHQIENWNTPLKKAAADNSKPRKNKIKLGMQPSTDSN
jgi:hypothetical protein